MDLENHLRICQPDELVYTKMKVLLLDRELWNKYIVINNQKMKCSKCEYEVDDVVSLPEDKVPLLQSHWRYCHYRMGFR